VQRRFTLAPRRAAVHRPHAAARGAQVCPLLPARSVERCHSMPSMKQHAHGHRGAAQKVPAANEPYEIEPIPRPLGNGTAGEPLREEIRIHQNRESARHAHCRRIPLRASQTASEPRQYFDCTRYLFSCCCRHVFSREEIAQRGNVGQWSSGRQWHMPR